MEKAWLRKIRLTTRVSGAITNPINGVDNRSGCSLRICLIKPKRVNPISGIERRLMTRPTIARMSMNVPFYAFGFIGAPHWVQNLRLAETLAPHFWHTTIFVDS